MSIKNMLNIQYKYTNASLSHVTIVKKIKLGEIK